MSKPPLPQPLTDEQAAELDYLSENYESDTAWYEWQTALGWAKKGDFAPMAECLMRTNLPLNNDDARAWLAEGLIKGFTKPRRIAKRPEYVSFEMDGRHFKIDKRHLNVFQAMELFRQTKAALGEDEAIRRAAKQFGMKAKTLREHLRRPRSHWGLQPASRDDMFKGVI